MSINKFVIGNWKMQAGFKEGFKLAKELKIKSSHFKFKGEMVLCPDFTNLEAVFKLIKNTKIRLGAQNCSAAIKGAYTGEVSAKNLKELGAKYIIIGHSERRHIFGETDQLINQKLKTILSAFDRNFEFFLRLVHNSPLGSLCPTSWCNVPPPVGHIAKIKWSCFSPPPSIDI